MSPKQKKPNSHENNEEEETPFQAVILTDSFEEQFLPISHEMPRVSKFRKSHLLQIIKTF
jgi:translation initiation factor eIF-2B subunit epsilon